MGKIYEQLSIEHSHKKKRLQEETLQKIMRRTTIQANSAVIMILEQAEAKPCCTSQAPS